MIKNLRGKGKRKGHGAQGGRFHSLNYLKLSSRQPFPIDQYF